MGAGRTFALFPKALDWSPQASTKSGQGGLVGWQPALPCCPASQLASACWCCGLCWCFVLAPSAASTSCGTWPQHLTHHTHPGCTSYTRTCLAPCAPASHHAPASHILACCCCCDAFHAHAHAHKACHGVVLVRGACDGF